MHVVYVNIDNHNNQLLWNLLRRVHELFEDYVMFMHQKRESERCRSLILSNLGQSQTNYKAIMSKEGSELSKIKNFDGRYVQITLKELEILFENRKQQQKLHFDHILSLLSKP